MHFDIEAVDTGLPLEARAYLEFRVFSALTRLGAAVFAVRVEVRGLRTPAGADEIRCRIRVLLRPAGEIVLERRAARLYAAIDRVADAAAEVLDPAAGATVP
jgi:hypothetical protein